MNISSQNSLTIFRVSKKLIFAILQFFLLICTIMHKLKKKRVKLLKNGFNFEYSYFHQNVKRKLLNHIGYKLFTNSCGDTTFFNPFFWVFYIMIIVTLTGKINIWLCTHLRDNLTLTLTRTLQIHPNYIFQGEQFHVVFLTL